MGVLVSFALTPAPVRRQIRLSFDLEAFWKSFGASMGMIIVVCLAQYVSYNRLLLPAYVAMERAHMWAGSDFSKPFTKPMSSWPRNSSGKDTSHR